MQICRDSARVLSLLGLRRVVLDLVGDGVDGIAQMVGELVQLGVLLHLVDAKVDGHGGNGYGDHQNEQHRDDDAERAAATAGMGGDDGKQIYRWIGVSGSERLGQFTRVLRICFSCVLAKCINCGFVGRVFELS